MQKIQPKPCEDSTELPAGGLMLCKEGTRPSIAVTSLASRFGLLKSSGKALQWPNDEARIDGPLSYGSCNQSHSDWQNFGFAARGLYFRM